MYSVPGVRQSDSVISTHIYMYIHSFFRFFSIMGYYKILITFPVLYNKPFLFIYFIYNHIYLLISNSEFIPPPPTFPPEKAMAPHSRTLAWKIPWTEEPGRLQSMGSRRVGHDWLHFHFSLSSIGVDNGNPLQCSCLENPRDGGAW